VSLPHEKLATMPRQVRQALGVIYDYFDQLAITEMERKYLRQAVETLTDKLVQAPLRRNMQDIPKE
jgi:hypothetical protein